MKCHKEIWQSLDRDTVAYSVTRRKGTGYKGRLVFCEQSRIAMTQPRVIRWAYPTEILRFNRRDAEMDACLMLAEFVPNR